MSNKVNKFATYDQCRSDSDDSLAVCHLASQNSVWIISGIDNIRSRVSKDWLSIMPVSRNPPVDHFATTIIFAVHFLYWVSAALGHFPCHSRHCIFLIVFEYSKTVFHPSCSFQTVTVRVLLAAVGQRVIMSGTYTTGLCYIWHIWV